MHPRRTASTDGWRHWTVCTVAAFAAAGAVAADDARARFEQERARCASGQSHQDRATCLKEAQNAYAEAQRGRLDNGQQALHRRNALARCDRLPEAERTDCVSRVQGQGHASGSVEGGGIYRETVTVESGQPESAPSGTTGTSSSGTSSSGTSSSGTSSSGTSSSGTSGMGSPATTPVAPLNTTGNAPGSATVPMPPAQPPVQPAQ